MAMLAKPAETIYGGQMSRKDEVDLVLGAPYDLAVICSRPLVWRTFPNGIGMVAWTEGQDRLRIADLDWIEYVPE